MCLYFIDEEKGGLQIAEEDGVVSGPSGAGLEEPKTADVEGLGAEESLENQEEPEETGSEDKVEEQKRPEGFVQSAGI